MENVPLVADRNLYTIAVRQKCALLAAVAVVHIFRDMIMAMSTVATTMNAIVAAQTKCITAINVTPATAQATVMVRFRQRRPVHIAAVAESFIVFVQITLTVLGET